MNTCRMCLLPLLLLLVAEVLVAGGGLVALFPWCCEMPPPRTLLSPLVMFPSGPDCRESV